MSSIRIDRLILWSLVFSLSCYFRVGLNASKIKIADGFEVTQVYAVPRESQGSWVALCVDPKGRLIAGDQYGGLFRISLNQLKLWASLLDM